MIITFLVVRHTYHALKYNLIKIYKLSQNIPLDQGHQSTKGNSHIKIPSFSGVLSKAFRVI